MTYISHSSSYIESGIINRQRIINKKEKKKAQSGVGNLDLRNPYFWVRLEGHYLIMHATVIRAQALCLTGDISLLYLDMHSFRPSPFHCDLPRLRRFMRVFK